MPLAVDASSPPITWAIGSTASAQTAPFAPPGGALLVVCAGCNQYGTLATVTFNASSTGVTGLTWTTVLRRDNAENGHVDSGAAAILVAALPGTTSSMTVSMSATNAENTPWLAVYVVTGADIGVAAVGATAEGGRSTTDPLTGSLTATRSGSLLFVAATEWEASGVPTSVALTDQGFDQGTATAAVAGYRAMVAPPTATTWDFDSPGTPVSWTWCAAEIKEAPTDTAAQNSIEYVNRARFRAATW